MPGALTIKLNIKDSFSNAINRLVPFLKQRGRNLASELEKYALKQGSKVVFGVYRAYDPKVYARTYRLMEGVRAVGSYQGFMDLSIALFNTAKNTSSQGGSMGFPYPTVVEFGQGSSAMGEQDVANRVSKAMGKSQEAIFVNFTGEYGWHKMPPRPSLIPAAIATGNYLYYNRLGKIINAWATETGKTRRVEIVFGGR